MHHWLRALLVAGLCGALTACGSTTRQPAQAGRDSATFIRQQLDELNAMSTPAGINTADWLALTSALRAHLEFRLQGERTVLSVPTTNGARASLSLSSGTQTLAWYYTLPGDYDENGLVTIGDLTPLGKKFHASSGGGSFGAGTLERMIDGDNNGEINLADIGPIGQNLGSNVASYNVYTSINQADYPTSNTGPNGVGTIKLGTLDLADGTGDPHTSRIHFSIPSGVILPTSVFWVRPNDGAGGAGTDGTPSSMAGTAVTSDVSGTVLTDAAQPLAGVTVALSGASNQQTTTAADGTYLISGVPSGPVTVTPTIADVDFTPVSTNVVVGTDNTSGLDFTGHLNINLTPYDFHLDLGSGPNEIAHFDKGTSIDCFVEPGVGVSGWQASFDDAIKAAVTDWNTVAVPWGLFKIRLTNNLADAEMNFHWVTSLGGQTIGRANIAVTSPPNTITLPYDIEMATGNIDGPATDTVVRMVTVHELGHALGLWQHSDQNTDIMFPSVGGFEQPSRRDMWTMYTLYNTPATYSSTGRGPASIGPPQHTYKTYMDFVVKR